MPRNENLVRRTARYNGRRYEAFGKTEREAMLNLAAKLEAAKRGEETVGAAMSVDAWFSRWKSLYKDPKGLTAKSLSMYDEKYNNYIKPRIGHMKLKDVRDVHLQAILNDQAGRSKSHVSKLRLLMRQLFARARQSRLIAYDPAELLELPAVSEGHRRSITPEERAAILAVAATHPAGPWVLAMLYTGMRPGEITALNCADIDFTNNEIHVHTAVESGSSRIKGTKTAAGVRDIPIHAALRPVLQQATKDRGPFEPVFRNSKHERLRDAGAILAQWKSFRRALNIHLGAKTYRNKLLEDLVAPDLTPYCLRHTFCSDLQRAGVPLNVAKELMGHTDITVTANIYTHKDRSVLHKNMAILDGTGGTTGGTKKNIIP